MAKTRAALAALMLLLPVAAHAETVGQKWFGDYLNSLPTATTPLSGTDRLPVMQNGTVRTVLGTSLLGSSAACPSVPPASCSGVADGCLYNNAGTPAFCGAVVSSPSAIALNAGGCLALNNGGCLGLNGH